MRSGAVVRRLRVVAPNYEWARFAMEDLLPELRRNRDWTYCHLRDLMGITGTVVVFGWSRLDDELWRYLTEYLQYKPDVVVVFA